MSGNSRARKEIPVTISTLSSTSYSLVTKSVRVRGNVLVSAPLFVDPCMSPYPCPWSCSWNVSVFVSVDMCPCPRRCPWTRPSVCVRVRGHALWWRHCSMVWWPHCKEPARKGSKSKKAEVCKRPKMKGILQFSSFFQDQCTDHQSIAECS